VKRRVAAVLLAAGVAAASPAAAQVPPARPREAPRTGSVELSGGVGFVPAISGESTAAELTRSGESSGGFDLFRAEGELTGGAAGVASLELYVSRTIALEAGLRYSRPHLRYRLSADFEEAPAITAEETLTRYLFTGSLVWHLRAPTRTTRFIPFIRGGGGYLRDLHQGNELVETGAEFHAGAGVKYWFGTAPRRFGLRADAGVSVTEGGFDFKEDARAQPFVSAALVWLLR
jgi:hypothetical protein